MEDELVAGTDPAEKGERLAIAAHQHVLTVVDEVAGLWIYHRIGSAAEPRLAFEQRHPKAAISQGDTRTESGEAATDYRYVAVLDHRALRRPPT